MLFLFRNAIITETNTHINSFLKLSLTQYASGVYYAIFLKMAVGVRFKHRTYSR
jgi:hypothetical protein